MLKTADSFLSGSSRSDQFIRADHAFRLGLERHDAAEGPCASRRLGQRATQRLHVEPEVLLAHAARLAEHARRVVGADLERENAPQARDSYLQRWGLPSGGA